MISHEGENKTLLKRPGQPISEIGYTTRMHQHQMWMRRDWDGSREGGWVGVSCAPYDDRVRVCIRRREQRKINQKINKTLKSLQSTEQDPAATSSFSVDEAESKYSADKAEYTPQRSMGIFVEKRQCSLYTVHRAKHFTCLFFETCINVLGLRHVTYGQSG